MCHICSTAKVIARDSMPWNAMRGGSVPIPSEEGEKNQGFKDIYLNANSRIWPRLAHLFLVCSTALYDSALDPKKQKCKINIPSRINVQSFTEDSFDSRSCRATNRILEHEPCTELTFQGCLIRQRARNLLSISLDNR